MRGKFREGNNETATFVSVMVLLVCIFGGSLLSLKLKVPGVGALFVAVVSVALTLLVSYVLTRGSFSADKRGVEFKVGFATHYYSYRKIKNISVDTIFERGRHGKIPYVQIELLFISGETMTFCDSVPNSRSDTIEELQQYQAEHQFTELCEYIKEKIENSGDWKKEYLR